MSTYYEYLDSLPLTQDEKVKVSQQGYDSAASLYSVVRAVDNDTIQLWLGRDCRDELIKDLEKLLTPEELAELNKPTPQWSLGANSPEEEVQDEAAAVEAERKWFARSLVANGQAAVPDANGNLPPGATHAIVGYEEDGTPIVERRRFC